MGLLLFSLILAGLQSAAGVGDVVAIITAGVWDIGGAVILGFVIGVPMVYLTGHIRPGEATQAEALGLVMLCAGLAVWFDVSYLLATMVLGIVVANFAKFCERPFRAIEGVEWPFLILFFLLAGASLHLSDVGQVGVIGIGYVFLRIIGRILGGIVGGKISHMGKEITCWMGVALLPQAGVAIGMVLLAVQRFPELGDILLPIILGSTVMFEIIGPVLTRHALLRIGDISPSKE